MIGKVCRARGERKNYRKKRSQTKKSLEMKKKMGKKLC